MRKSAPLSVLSFIHEHELVTSEFGDGEYLAVTVRPLIDGEPLVGQGSLVFDAIECLVIGASCGSTDLLTCSCGVAGCAGIFESTRLEADVQAGTMAWVFPPEALRKLPSLAAPQAAATLRLLFSLPQYEQALADLVTSLESLQLQEQRPVVVAPSHGPSGNQELEPLGAQIERFRGRRNTSLGIQAQRAEAVGELALFEAIAILPNGATLKADLADVAWCLVDGELDDAAQLLHLTSVVKPLLLADAPGEMHKHAWETFEAVFWWSGNTPTGVRRDDEEMARQWLGATVRVCPSTDD